LIHAVARQFEHSPQPAQSVCVYAACTGLPISGPASTDGPAERSAGFPRVAVTLAVASSTLLRRDSPTAHAGLMVDAKAAAGPVNQKSRFPQAEAFSFSG
jgi:hypothetical protein